MIQRVDGVAALGTMEILSEADCRTLPVDSLDMAI